MLAEDFTRMMDTFDWLMAKGSPGDIQVKLLRGWFWETRGELPATKNPERFEKLMVLVKEMCAAYPNLYVFTSDAIEDSDADLVIARRQRDGMGQSLVELSAFAKRTIERLGLEAPNVQR